MPLPPEGKFFCLNPFKRHRNISFPFAMIHVKTMRKSLISYQPIMPMFTRFNISQLFMHNEIERADETTVCPGDHMVPLVQQLRAKLKMRSK